VYLSPGHTDVLSQYCQIVVQTVSQALTGQQCMAAAGSNPG